MAPKECDELAAYLAEAQVKLATEKEVLEWWQTHAPEFPNVAVKAWQYLGCPATSATVERLFSKVGSSYCAKRKSSHASTLITDLAFTAANI